MALAVSMLLGIKSPNIWDYQLIFIYLQQIKNDLMGTMSKIQELRARRRVYQAQKTKEYKQRIAAYLSDADKRILFSGEGFIRVPEEEAKREKIDVYPYLIQ